MSAERPGWRIVLDAFLAARDHKLTNHELGDLRGVQAFRSRIADLRRMGCDISEGRYVSRGKYEYQLLTWPPDLAPRPAPERDRIAAHQDHVAEAPDPEPLGLFEPPPAAAAPTPHYAADF